MTSPHINQVRQHLLDTLADLRCPHRPMEPERARVVAQVAAVLVDTARVEVDYLKATGLDHSKFIEGKFAPNQLPEHSAHRPFKAVK